MISKLITLFLSLVIAASGLGLVITLAPSALPLIQTQADNVATPSILSIPKLNLETRIETVGNDDQGRMAPPQNFNYVSWWQYGAKPGQPGTAVLAGHIDTPTGSLGTFYHLSQLDLGDQVFVIDTQGRRHPFEVIAKQIYSTADFPVDLVFTGNSAAYLNLITCAGSFKNQDYNHRLVVFTKALQ